MTQVFRPALWILLVAALLLAVVAPAPAAETYTFYGRGTAHGVGLDMAGVQALAKQGKGYQEILKTYYTGVTISGGYSGNWLRIGLANSGSIQVTAGSSYKVFVDGAGPASPTVMVAAGTITRVSYANGKYITTVDGGGSWTKAKHTWFSANAGGRLKLVNNGRRYRGRIEAKRSSSSGLLWAINYLNIESYVKGIAEEPNTWPREGQRTLAVAARTYALNKLKYSTRWDSENFDLDATMGSQYYLGVDAERSNLVAATDHTKGRVVTYNGKIIVAAYHGNSGGHTEALHNVWGGKASDYPYLRAVASPWTPVFKWGPVTFTKKQLQDIFNSHPEAAIGTLYYIDFSDRGPSGRLRKVKLIGSRGTKEIWGYSQFKAWLGLRSALVDVGTPDDQWDSRLMLQNPGGAAAAVDMTFYFSKGPPKVVSKTVGPRSRSTVEVDQLVAPGPVAVRIKSSQPIVAERAAYFNYDSGINGGHGSLGIKAPEKRWYIPEGRTDPEFDNWISVVNPRGVKARVTATFMPGNGRRVRKTLVLQPRTRKAFYVNRIPGLSSAPVPAVVTSKEPVVVERTTYLNWRGYRGGHSSRAASDLSKTWYFAEGYTGKGFQTRLQIFNPSAKRTKATVWLSKANGDQFKRRVTIGPRYRRSILLNRWVSGRSFGIRVIADDPVVAARTVYFKTPDKVGIHSAVGSPRLTRELYFAGGETTGGFEEYLTVLNPFRRRANLTIEYFPEGSGAVKTTNHSIPANSRATYVVGAPSEAGPDRSVAVRIKSDSPIAAERVTYFNASVNGRSGAYVTPGAVSPSKRWFFAEGVTE